LLFERKPFSEDVASRLASAVVPAAARAEVKASTRFSYFETDEEFLVVSGIQEGVKSELALAYGPPMHGQTRCRMHGGVSPQVRASARRRVAARLVVEGGRAVLMADRLGFGGS